ncbi:MAG: hypothetical protein DRH12_12235, partial [Deltaproteobacteria bacterium]
FWLKGDLVAHQRLAVAGSSKFVEFTVKNASKAHLIQIRTDKKQKLQIRLLDYWIQRVRYCTKIQSMCHIRAPGLSHSLPHVRVNTNYTWD